MTSAMRIGQGFDVHALVVGRPLIIGGVEIPYAQGLLGHSDADVLLHAITDALLGAAALGDIGRHFPDSDPQYRGRYGGDPFSRDTAYHQGTVWPWLTGPFITAYLKVNGRTPEARGRAAKWLDEFRRFIADEGVGQIPEAPGLGNYLVVELIHAVNSYKVGDENEP